MGTKNNPGQFDCYASAEPDEPIFTLKAKDPTAPQVVAYWIELNQGVQPKEKIDEAHACASAMIEWKAGAEGES